MKNCLKCCKTLSFDMFYISKKNYYSSRCKKCQTLSQKEYQKEYYKKYYTEKERERRKTAEYKQSIIKYRKTDGYKQSIIKYKNSEKYKQSFSKYRKSEKYKECQKIYDQKRREGRKEYHKEYNKINKEKIKERAKIHQKTDKYIINKIKYRKSIRAIELRKINTKNKIASDINFRLSILLRSRLRKAIKNNQKVGSAVCDLGCTIPELKIYLENQFTEGMTWDNHGTHGWHIDHKNPLDSFDLTDREHFLKAVHYTNLQPLWAFDNLSKRNKITPI